MLKALTRLRVLQIWFGAVAVTIAIGLAWGVSVTMSTAVLVLASCLVPPGILLIMWREAPPTVAVVINVAERRA